MAKGLLAATILIESAGVVAQQPTPMVLEATAVGISPVARVVKGIISYTHWPSEPQVVQLCIVGSARHQEQLLAGVPIAPGRAVRVQQVAIENRAALRACNALYIGALPAEAVAILLAPGRSILTIKERDPDCRDGSMFCLDIMSDRVAFDMNLDSVARSGLRVDPKALMLGRTGARQQ